MNVDVRTYRQQRALGIPAKYAYAIAKPAPAGLDWHNEPRTGNLTVTVEQDGFTVTLRTEPDTYADLDGFGTFTARKEAPDAIPNPNGSERDGTAWYVPNQSTAELVAHYRASGYSRGPAHDMAREMRERELSEARADHYAVGLIATASRADVELGNASVWGIELDGGRNDETYLSEMAPDLIAEAVEEARAALARLNVKD